MFKWLFNLLFAQKEIHMDETKSSPAHDYDLRFKDESKVRLDGEWTRLNGDNKALCDIIIDAAKYCHAHFGKPTTITMIYRTQLEQDGFYKNDPKYKKEKFFSPHQLWSAVDLRSHIYTQAEIDQLVEYLNGMYNKSNLYAWTTKCHEVSDNGMHFHVQYRLKD